MGQARVAVPLIITTLGALAAIVALTIVGWIVIGNVNDQNQDGDHIEVLRSAVEVSRLSSSLAAAGAVESNASMTRESLVASRSAIAGYKAGLNEELTALEGLGYDGHVSDISERVGQLVSNVERIDGGRPELLRALAAGEESRQRLAAATTRLLVPAIWSSLDDQYYYMLTGRSEARGDDVTLSESFRPQEFLRYDHMATLQRSIVAAHSYLSIAARMNDPTLVTNVEEAFGSAALRMQRSLLFLSQNGGPDLNPRVLPLTRNLLDAGIGEGNYFDALRKRLSLAVSERALIAANGQIVDGLNAEIDALVQAVGVDHASLQEDSDQTASTGRLIVLIIGIVGVVVTVLGAGYVGLMGRRE